jgi:hypothetical protein
MVLPRYRVEHPQFPESRQPIYFYMMAGLIKEIDIVIGSDKLRADHPELFHYTRPDGFTTLRIPPWLRAAKCQPSFAV